MHRAMGRIGMIVVLAGWASPAWSQLAAPPEPKPEPLSYPQYRPPINIPRERVVALSRRVIAQERWTDRYQEFLDALVRKDESGNLVKAEGLPELAAIRAYPAARQAALNAELPEEYARGETVRFRDVAATEDFRAQGGVDAELLEQAEVAAADRRDRILRGLLADLEVVRELTGGLIDEVSPFDRESMALIRELVSLIKPQDTLIDELEAQGLLDEPTSKDLRAMVERYRAAVRNDVFESARTAEGEADIQSATRLFWRDQISEPLMVYEDLVLHASRNLDALANAADPSTETRQALDRASQSLRGIEDRAERLEVMLDTLNSLPIEVHRAVLERAIATR